MKFIKLREYAYVSGVARSPDQGVFSVHDEEAQRLIDADLAVDVSSDFSADDMPPPPPTQTVASDQTAAVVDHETIGTPPEPVAGDTGNAPAPAAAAAPAAKPAKE